MSNSRSAMPRQPIDRLVAPLRRFMEIEAASGFVLLAAAAMALGLANSPWSGPFLEFWNAHLQVGIGEWQIDESLIHWINDGLMTLFFFVVGLEIKREVVHGELQDPRKAALPLIAALGGMIVPAILYLILLGDAPGKKGWGIPMATDIAFAVGFLALLGTRVPLGLKVLLLTLAIVDDIGAILIIAIFYSTGVSATALTLAATGFGLIIICRCLGVRSVAVYSIVGIAIWLAMFHSGVHPTIAGVILGLLTPASPALNKPALLDELTATFLAKERSESETGTLGHTNPVGRLKTAVLETVSPLERLEIALHPWVAFLIMPLFALANAGVTVDLEAISQPVALSVAIGLAAGKPLGITAFGWFGFSAGLAKLPAGVTWAAVIGASCLAGIGFTMSLFVAGLAFVFITMMSK
jgi:NhaA family Na+:H+ antiporter